MGVSFGVLLNPMFPEWLILVLLMAIVIYMAIDTFRKARRLWAKESADKAEVKEKSQEPVETRPLTAAKMAEENGEDRPREEDE